MQAQYPLPHGHPPPPLWTPPPISVGTWLELPIPNFCIGPAQAIFVPLYRGPPRTQGLRSNTAHFRAPEF